MHSNIVDKSNGFGSINLLQAYWELACIEKREVDESTQEHC
jgi:hypothetical protein